MNPSDPWATSSNQAAEQRKPSERAARVFDTVKVAPETFSVLMFMRSQARKQYTQDNRPAAEKPQKKTSDGVPLWSVQVSAIDWRGRPQLVSVTVPSWDDPAEKFTAGAPIELPGFVFGVSPKDGGGFVTWCSADDLRPVGAVQLKAAAS